MASQVPAHLADHLKRLREERGLTQQQAAELAGVPRPTWATLESGSANPTLNVLIRAAAALRVSIEELIAAPRSAGRVVRAADVKLKQRPDSEVRALLPDAIPGMSMERFELKNSAQLARAAHAQGAREYLVCERGRVELSTSVETWLLEVGDVLAFSSDRRHTLRNVGRDSAVAFSVVALAPPGV